MTHALFSLILLLTLTACSTPCRDGTTSRSRGPGTCSHHGGIRR